MFITTQNQLKISLGGSMPNNDLKSIRKKAFAKRLEDDFYFIMYIKKGEQKENMECLRDIIYNELRIPSFTADRKKNKHVLLLLCMNLSLSLLSRKVISISFKNKKWAKKSYLRGCGASRELFKTLFSALEKNNYIQVKKGTEITKKRTRFWATSKFLDLFIQKNIDYNDLQYDGFIKKISLKNSEKELIDFETTPTVETMYKNLDYINSNNNNSTKQVVLDSLTKISYNSLVYLFDSIIKNKLEFDASLTKTIGKVETKLIKKNIDNFNIDGFKYQTNIFVDLYSTLDNDYREIYFAERLSKKNFEKGLCLMIWSVMNSGVRIKSGKQDIYDNTNGMGIEGTGINGVAGCGNNSNSSNNIIIEILLLCSVYIYSTIYAPYRYGAESQPTEHSESLHRVRWFFSMDLQETDCYKDLHRVNDTFYNNKQTNVLNYFYQMDRLVSFETNGTQQRKFKEREFFLSDFGFESLTVDLNYTPLFRRFNNSSFYEGGRFYSLWQSLPKKLRPFIKVDNDATIELDFSGSHIRMLYHTLNIDIEGDPYYIKGYSSDDERKILKLIGLISINGSKINSVRFEVIKSMRKKKIKYEYEKINKLIDLYLEKHLPIKQFLFSGIGIKLQFKEACILENILLRLAEKNITSLPIHDSVIVQKQHGELLHEFMEEEYEKIMLFKPSIH